MVLSSPPKGRRGDGPRKAPALRTARRTLPEASSLGPSDPDFPLGEWVIETGKRIRYYRDLGSIPDCPEWRQYEHELKAELGRHVLYLTGEARELAEGLRDQLITGRPTPSDSWRLFGHLQECLCGTRLEVMQGAEGLPFRLGDGGYVWSGNPRRILLQLPEEPEQDSLRLPAIIGAAIVPWRRPDGRANRCPEAYRLWRLIDRLVGEAFARAWRGVDEAIGRAEKRAGELKQALGITGAPVTTDAWRLLTHLGYTLKREDTPDGWVIHWPDPAEPAWITLPEHPTSPEAEADELLLMIGHALLTGFAGGFTFDWSNAPLIEVEVEQADGHEIARAFVTAWHCSRTRAVEVAAGLAA